MISNDSDLKLPIEIAQNELGLRVGVVNPHPPSALAACQFPSVLRDERGEIRKPSRW